MISAFQFDGFGTEGGGFGKIDQFLQKAFTINLGPEFLLDGPFLNALIEAGRQKATLNVRQTNGEEELVGKTIGSHLQTFLP
jgi:hypothetical protein